MREYFEKQMEQLNKELIRMGTSIENAIEMAVSALENRDVDKAKKAIDMDSMIDRKERDIESLCMKLLLLQQPMAGDLRIISAALKMITDMERIGDQAADISEITILLADAGNPVNLETIRKMAVETIYMVNQSVEAFVGRNLTLAEQVIAHDDIVDALFLQAKKDLTQLMKQNTQDSEQAADLLMVAKYFERIGDHAVNIAEWVIYFMSGSHDTPVI